MMELLGPIPRKLALAGKKFDDFFGFDEFTGKFTFKKIQGLQYFPLKHLLMEKYRFKATEAHQLSDFLLKILKWDLKERATA
jgi:serine/threonine-protein kinase SRPK3